MKVCAISPISGGNDSRKRQQKRFIFKIGTIHPHKQLTNDFLNQRFSSIWSLCSFFIFYSIGLNLLFMLIHLPLIFTSHLRLVCWLTLKIANDLPILLHLIIHYFVIVFRIWLASFRSHDYFSYISSLRGFLFILCFPDEGPTLETLDFAFCIGSTPTFFISISSWLVIGCVKQESISHSFCIELFALFHHAGFNMFQSTYIVFWFILILGTSIRKRDERAKTVSQSCKTWYGYCGRYLCYNGISWLSILPECVQRKHYVKFTWNTVRIHIKSIELAIARVNFRGPKSIKVVGYIHDRWQMETTWRPASRVYCHGYYQDQHPLQARAILRHYANSLFPFLPLCSLSIVNWKSMQCYTIPICLTSIHNYQYVLPVPCHHALPIYTLLMCLTSMLYQYALPIRLMMPYQYALPAVCLTNMPYQYTCTLPICFTNMPYQYALPICLTNMPYQYALPICLTNMPCH